jgi:hypothetical protein
MVEMIRLADEPWAPVAQGHPGAEVVRSVRVALRGTNATHQRAGARRVDFKTDPTAGSVACDGYVSCQST